MRQNKWNKYNVLTYNGKFIFTINEMYKFTYIKKNATINYFLL